jgi:hypothetical protein
MKLTKYSFDALQPYFSTVDFFKQPKISQAREAAANVVN